jgi:methylglutaconyl-CoA hydratase
MTTLLLTSLDAGVLTLTLNRPYKRNALNADLLDRLHQVVERADLDADVRVLVIRGAGKDFCAGADLDELLASVECSESENEASALRLGTLFERLRAVPKPVIAMVHGRALAGGAGLATACDLIVAAADAQLGYPEIQRGFAPAMVTALLRRIVGEKIALVSRVVPPAELERETVALAAELARASGTALAFTKRLFYELDGASLAEGIARGARLNAVARSTPDFHEAVARFLRK